MMKTERLKKYSEDLVYGLVWAAVFAAPVVVLYMHAVNSSSQFQWSSLLFIWQRIGLFFSVFLVHNYVLSPLLIYQHRRVLYFSLMAGIVALFVLVQCYSRPADPLHRPLTEEMRPHARPPHPDGNQSGMHKPHPDAGDKDFEAGPPPLPWETDSAATRPHPDGPLDVGRHHGPGSMHRDGGPARQEPPMAIIGQHDVVATIVLLLMLGANLAIKLYFKQLRDGRAMAEMRRRNLEQQLEYLKYQINPHFLMNTLNNIHALIDIDAEAAKTAVVELSHIMRFVLYDGARPLVPLQRELDFIDSYVKLMRMRYANAVGISVSLPEHCDSQEVPPLIFITYIENAFKHGVSYRQPSFVDIRIDVDDKRIRFECVNSKVEKAAPTGDATDSGGVGLANARRRLDLLYADSYTLNVDDGPERYSVVLNLPLKTPRQTTEV